MGIIDKVKGFLNAEGLKVEVTSIDNPFLVGDTVLKGSFSLTAGGDCEVLSTRATFVLQKRHTDGRIEDVILGQEDTAQAHQDDRQYPIALHAGERREVDFRIVQVSIPEALQSLGYPEPAGGLATPDVKFFLKVAADARGTPFDPSAQVDVTVALPA